MQYLLLIYEDEAALPGHIQADPDFLPSYGRLSQALKASGEWIAGEPLRPTATATSVRVRNGEVLLTDGPFAETREQLGGFFLVEAENLDRALAIAARIPSARNGTIEVRPIQTWTGEG